MSECFNSLHTFDFSFPSNIYGLSTVQGKESSFVFCACGNNVHCVQVDKSTAPQASHMLPQQQQQQKQQQKQQQQQQKGRAKRKMSNASSTEDGQSQGHFYTPFSSLYIRQLPLTMISPESDIIAICAFRLQEQPSSSLSPQESKIVLGVCVTQHFGENRPSCSFFNVYMFLESTLVSYCNHCDKGVHEEEEETDDLHKEIVNHLLESFELGFVPLQLTTTTIQTGGVQNQLFLLSGTDKHVHCYFLDQTFFSGKNIGVSTLFTPPGISVISNSAISTPSGSLPPPATQYEVREARIGNIYPELTELSSSALFIDIFKEDGVNAVAIGCQNGHVTLSIQNQSTLAQQQQQQQQQQHQKQQKPLLSNVSFKKLLTSPISAAKFFKLESSRTRSHPLIAALKDHAKQTLPNGTRAKNLSEEELQSLHLIVSESVGRVILFRNVLRSGLSDAVVLSNYASEQLLPDTAMQDSVLCIHVADINADGINEILLGTYSKRVIMYMLEDRHEKVTAADAETPHVDNSNAVPDTVYNEHHTPSLSFYQSDCIRFPSPVHSISTLDINGDGIVEVIVSTMYTLHVIQPELTSITGKLVKRMDTLAEILLLAGQSENEEEHKIVSMLLHHCKFSASV